MTFYLVGPSGAGKSQVAQELEARNVVRHVDTDYVWRSHNENSRPWASPEGVLADLVQWDADEEEPPLLVAIGAGTQDIDRCSNDQPIYEWLLSRRKRVITVYCPPEEIIERNCRGHNSVSELKAIEFAPARVAIYELSDLMIATDLHDVQDVADQIERYLGAN